MEFILLAVGVVLIVLAVRSAKNRAAEKAAAEAAAEAARQQAEKRESALVPRISAANSPAGVLALCDHRPPPSLRFQKSEEPVWVVPDCGYLKTKKDVTFEGRSAGASFRVAKGVTIRTGGSRGHRVENEYLEQVDVGTVVLTNKHIYFQGTDKERFRVRLDKLVSAETAADGFLFQRDGVRARPEAFVSYDVRTIAVLLHWLEDPEPGAGGVVDMEAEPDEMLDALAASEADRGDQ